MITVRGAGLFVAAATAAAGLVGVARQRIELSQVRRGALTPATAATVVAPAHEPGRFGARVAAWRPSRPSTTSGRLAATLWASPLTTVGIALAVLGGAVPRWDTDRGCLVASGVRGPSGVALAAVGADANTIGQVVLARHRHPSPVLLDHEMAHVRQSERLGPFLLPAYVWLAARYGYRDHPLERAARDVARSHRTP